MCAVRAREIVVSASASGKTILLGEHSVVYGRPAIAVPISDVRATVEVSDPGCDSSSPRILIVAEDLGQTYDLRAISEDQVARPLQVTVLNTLEHLGLASDDQQLRITIHSQIPIARGLGSGTAVATALVRALASHFGQPIPSRAVSDLVYETETILHGTPSGIDNTVVAFEKPVFFVKNERRDIFWVAEHLSLLVADTGIVSRTRDTVAAVRQLWETDERRYDALFDEIGDAVREAREAAVAGNLERLGQLMNRNHVLLQELTVSSPELDCLVSAALRAGALGAKLSGGGRGGCMVALVDDSTRDDVFSALLLANARAVIATTVS